MSSLRTVKQTKNIIFKPSPTNRKDFVKNLLSLISKILYTSVKRVSRFTCEAKQRYLLGSMTVEAAVLLPLVLFSFWYLAGVIEMLRQHGTVTAKLWNVGNQMAIYGSTLSDFAEESEFLQSLCAIEDECVDIVVTYRVKPPVEIFLFGYRRMANRYYARCWTGYDVSDRTNIPQYVYVTPYGEVWHKTRECSYIYHEAEGVNVDEIEQLKNDYGERYELCELCKGALEAEQVYITKTGERYHRIKDCSAICKDVRAVEWCDDILYRPCSRCAEEE